MKMLLCLIGLLLMCHFTEAQIAIPFGPVKTMNSRFYDYSQKVTSPTYWKWFTSGVETYNKVGCLVHGFYLVEKSINSRRFDTTIMNYNNDGRPTTAYVNKHLSYNCIYTQNTDNEIVVKNILDKYEHRIINEKAGVDTFFRYDDSGKISYKSITKYNTEKTFYHTFTLDSNEKVTNESIISLDNHHRVIEQVGINNGVRMWHETAKYSKYGFMRLDSSKYNLYSIPPSKKISEKVICFIYKYPKIDKYGNPLITSFLCNGKYVITEVKKYKYYKRSLTARLP